MVGCIIWNADASPRLPGARTLLGALFCTVVWCFAESYNSPQEAALFTGELLEKGWKQLRKPILVLAL